MKNLERDCEIIGLKPDASWNEIKQAYKDLAKVKHPDCFPNAPELKQKAEEEFKQINAAYQNLKSYYSSSPNQTSGDRTANYSTNRLDAESYYKRGMENARKGRYKEAIEDFTGAIRLNPEYIEAYKYRGIACSKIGFENRAASDANKVAQLERKQKNSSPTNTSPHSSSPGARTANYSTHQSDAETYYNQGVEKARIGNYKEAIDEFTQAILLNPEYIEAYKYRGIACSKLGFENRAVSDAIKATQLERKQKNSSPTNTSPHSSSPWKCDRTLKEHVHWVYSIAISPDGQTLVSSSADKTIRIWHLATGKLLNTLKGHLDFIRSVAISPDGQLIASGSGDRSVKIWNLATGKLLHTLEGHTAPVWSVAISPDGNLLASGSCDKTIKIWNLKTGQRLHNQMGHSDAVYSLAFSPDGQTLVSGSADKTLKIWHLGMNQLLHVLKGHSSWVNSVAISPDGQQIASGSYDTTIKLWRLSTGKLLTTLKGHHSYIWSVFFGADSQTLISGSADHTIKLWQLGSEKQLYSLWGHSDWVNCVAYSRQRNNLVSCSRDMTIKIWQCDRA